MNTTIIIPDLYLNAILIMWLVNMILLAINTRLRYKIKKLDQARQQALAEIADTLKLTKEEQ